MEESSSGSLPAADLDVCPGVDTSGDGECTDPCDRDCVLTYPIHQAALAAFQANEASMWGSAARRAVPLADPRYAVATPILARLWEAAARAYPGPAAGLPVPWVILSEGSDGGSAAFTVRPVRRQLWMIRLDVSELARESATLTVIAHELTHLVLKHGALGEKERVYRAPAGLEPLASAQPADDELAAVLSEWLALSDRVGPTLLPELDGVAFEGVFARVLGSALAHEGNGSERCRTWLQRQTELGTTVYATYSQWFGDWAPDAPQSARIVELRRAIERDAAACLSDVAVRIEGFRLSEDEWATFEQAGALWPGIQENVRRIRRQLSAIRTAQDLGSARRYGREEEADDGAVRILRAAGLDGQIAEVELVSRIPPSDRSLCEAARQAGQVPPAGNIAADHPPLCFRAFRARQMNEFLDAPPR